LFVSQASFIKMAGETFSGLEEMKCLTLFTMLETQKEVITNNKEMTGVNGPQNQESLPYTLSPGPFLRLVFRLWLLWTLVSHGMHNEM